MLALRLHMEFTPGTCDEVAAVLRSLVGPVRSEPGCTQTRLLRDTGGQCGMTWVEEWRSVDEFEQHLRTPAFRQILAVIDMAAGPPEFAIDEVASRRGFELVEEILGAGTNQTAESLNRVD
jgi:quinol monooxygenase YgiN